MQNVSHLKMKIAPIALSIFIFSLCVDICLMIFLDASIFLGWDYFSGHYRWNPSLEWKRYIVHHVLVILFLSYFLCSMLFENIKRANNVLIQSIIENVTCIYSLKFKNIPTSIRIISTIIFLFVFYLFFIANFNELGRLLSALVIGDGYWGNIHLSNYRWLTLFSTFSLFIFGTIIANKLLKLNKAAYLTVYSIFSLTLATTFYLAVKNTYIVLTTESISSQPVGIPSHLSHYFYLCINTIIFSLVAYLLILLIRNKEIFLKHG